MQNLVVLMEPSKYAHRTPLKAGNMILNRFCIDEDAAFELSGVNYLKKVGFHSSIDTEKGKEYSENCIHSYSKLNFHEHLIILQKEHFDEEVITAALQKISENEAKELKIHFVYAGRYWEEDKLRRIILNGMKKHKLKSVMVTRIYLHRKNLITKEEMESYCKGEKKKKDSVNDDLESLFENIRLGKELGRELVETYFLPKLTEEELKLVERRDYSYLQSFYEGAVGRNPDVDETEMMLSESDSKYVRGFSRRKTFVIENSSKKSLKNQCSLQ